MFDSDRGKLAHNPDAVCSQCVFHKGVDSYNGSCHRYPTPIMTMYGHWCGEFKERSMSMALFEWEKSNGN